MEADLRTPQERWDDTYKRVMWWITDMAYKPPEVLTTHYYECMAQDIADFAAGENFSSLTATSRLDPKGTTHG